jgi:lipoprotein-releasing system ATP-binding protein|tara:strand:+ start:5338 stop:6036 length:699 start_codon:yes stop_codon:yes gene_type:complete
MTNKPIMHATDLSRHYRQGDVTLSVLSGVNLSIEAGEKVAIVGVSGSGKTTLLNLLGGLDDADRGEVFLAEKSWHDLGPSERAAWRNQHVGFVYQFHHLLGEFSALENVAMPLLIGSCSPTEARCRATQLLERVGLGDRLHHQPAELSGGERQRVAVARALVTEPSVVLMDEPTGNLDPHTAGAILNLLIELNESLNISFILVTHDPVIAAQMDRTLTLTDGLLVSENPAVV